MDTNNDIFAMIEKATPVQRGDERETMFERVVAMPVGVRSPYQFAVWQKVGVAVFGLLFVIGSVAGTVTASQSARPGDVLYPLDRAVESLQLLVVSEERAARLEAAFVDERIAEVESMVEDRKSSSEVLVSDEVLAMAIDELTAVLATVERTYDEERLRGILDMLKDSREDEGRDVEVYWDELDRDEEKDRDDDHEKDDDTPTYRKYDDERSGALEHTVYDDSDRDDDRDSYSGKLGDDERDVAGQNNDDETDGDDHAGQEDDGRESVDDRNVTEDTDDKSGSSNDEKEDIRDDEEDDADGNDEENDKKDTSDDHSGSSGGDDENDKDDEDE